MGSEFCSCEHFFVKTENESNMLSNSKKDLYSLNKKNMSEKRFEEESSTIEKYYKPKLGDMSSKNNDTIDKQPTNYIESTKKKGIFNINNSIDNENKENENKLNDKGENIMEKNQKEINNNIINNKSPFKKTFTFKDIYMKSNGENTDKKNINNSNSNTVENNNIYIRENPLNKMNEYKSDKKNFNKEEINIKLKIK